MKIPPEAWEPWTHQGLISTQRFSNGNMPGATGLSWTLEYLNGWKVPVALMDQVVKSIEVRPGLITRWPGYKDFTPQEDYWHLCTGLFVNGGHSIVHRIREYWDKHLGIMNSRQPGCPVLWDRVFSKKPWTAGAPIFARFPALYAHIVFCDNDSPSEGYRRAWRHGLSGDLRTKSQDGILQNWSMIIAYWRSKHRDAECDQQVINWWRRLDESGQTVGGVLKAHIGIPEHTLCVYWQEGRA